MCDNNLDERKEMIKKADELISKLDTRKDMVTELLEGELLKQADWWLIKNTSLVLDSRGQISSNSVLINLRSLTEPILQMFSDDLVVIRTGPWSPSSSPTLTMLTRMNQCSLLQLLKELTLLFSIRE